jgi:hypothetical protein
MRILGHLDRKGEDLAQGIDQKDDGVLRVLEIDDVVRPIKAVG